MLKKFDCIAIGAGLLDTFVQLKVAHHYHDSDKEDECFPLGSKIDVLQIKQQSGGGATNAAVTMARQRLTSAVICRVGDDPAGNLIQNELKREGVATEYLKIGGRSGQSVVLVDPNAERTILTDRGIGGHLISDDLLDMEQLSARWIYLTSQNGQASIIEQVMIWAEQHAAKVAWNPGLADLSLGHSIDRWLKMSGLVLMNREEAGDYLAVKDLSVSELASALRDRGVRRGLITDGPNKLAVIDEGKLFSLQPPSVRATDQTGAGDAFGSGTVAWLLRGQSFRQAIDFGLLNSEQVIKQIGAKTGIIYRKEEK